MTHQPETLALLRDTEHYLSALHGSVARHDNLAANYGCAGCELRDRIAAAVSAAVAPPTDRAAAEAALAAVEAALGDTLLPDAREEALARLMKVLPEPADRAAEPVCICGHPNEQHFEDVCQTCGCGDYLEPQDAAEVIARWRQAALKARADRATVYREAADQLGCMDYDTDSNDYGYDTYRDAWNGGVMDAADRLRRMADETATETPAPDDRNAGPGWYEVITSPQATTCIAYVHEDGSLYLPEGDLTEEEFAFAAARGKAHRLVRADEQPAAGARQDGAQP